MSEALAGLLERAAQALRADPQYGAVRGPADLGRHVRLVRDLEQRARELKATREIPPAADGFRLDDHGPDELVCAARPEDECLPTWVDAKLICLYCRRPMPSPRE